jgi:hypothetical protein
VPALPLRLDPRDERHETVDDTAEIDAHDPVVVGVTRFVGRTEHADAGIVDENVNGADLLRDLCPARAVGHIERHEARQRATVLRKPACACSR